jgi:hypothetical protein
MNWLPKISSKLIVYGERESCTSHGSTIRKTRRAFRNDLTTMFAEGTIGTTPLLGQVFF